MDKAALFDEYCINCDLAFVARVCLKIHNNSTRTGIVIHVISNLRPEYVSRYTLALLGASGKCSGPPVIYVISKYDFEEGRESKISSAKGNKIREIMIFLYDISMVKYDFSYVIYDNKYRYTTLHNILLEGEKNSTRTRTVVYVISNLCPECISRHVDTNPNCNECTMF